MEFRSNNNYQRNGYNQDRKKDFGPRKNEWIRISPVMVIDENGDNLGVMETPRALEMARDRGLDLVEVGPTVRPPVCKIIDYSKYLYEQKKKKKASKQSIKEMKELQFSPAIADNDLQNRVKRANEFLSKGHNVRLVMVRKGRQNPQLALEMFDKILTNFTEYSTIEPEKKVEGKTIYITIKANGKTKN